jgi:hypothetical protein
MAFLCTFSGMLAAGTIWMLLFVEFGDAASPALKSVSAWLSPMNVGGWCFYAVLSAGCSWLVYRVLRSKLGGVTHP